METPRTECLLIAQVKNTLEGMIQPENAAIFTPEIAAPLRMGLTRLEGAIANHAVKKDQVRILRDERQAARTAARKFVDDATDVLRPRLGSSPSAEWEMAGMPPGKLVKPERISEVSLRLVALNVYFTAKPTHEIPALGVTALGAAEVKTQLTSVNGKLNAALAGFRESVRERLEARGELKHAFRAVCELIATRIPADSAIWYSLSMPRPVDVRLPAKPAAPELRQIGPGTMQVSLAKVARAARYRVFVQAPGDEEAKAVATVRGLVAVITDLPVGVGLKFTVAAANRSGEGMVSEAAQATLT